MEKICSNFRNTDNPEKSCGSCELCMPDGKGNMVCAGSDENYGMIIPDDDIEIKVCDYWEESFIHFCSN